MTTDRVPDLDALERWARGLIKAPFSPERVDHGVEGCQVLALIQRVREAEAEMEALSKGNGALLQEAQDARLRIAQLEHVRRAAIKVIDPAEKLLTRKQRDWTALFALEQALAAVKDDH